MRRKKRDSTSEKSRPPLARQFEIKKAERQGWSEVRGYGGERKNEMENQAWGGGEEVKTEGEAGISPERKGLAPCAVLPFFSCEGDPFEKPNGHPRKHY